MSDKMLGKYLCPTCGPSEITDTSDIVIRYPDGIGMEEPQISIKCECGDNIRGWIGWEDAVSFDFAGATVQGFSFARGPQMTEEDIQGFTDNMEKEINEFLSVSKAE